MDANPISYPDLFAETRRVAETSDQVIVGLCGPPGVGKSTVAHRLAQELGTRAIAVGMDGFHLANATLDRLGLRNVKGAPETFDAEGFVALLERVRSPIAPRPIYAPTYDRSHGASIAGAVEIRKEHDIVIVEGNYLLMDGPWEPVRSLLDLSIYLRLDDDIRRQRLIERHISHGREPEQAVEWVHRSDEANARLIADTAARADWALAVNK